MAVDKTQKAFVTEALRNLQVAIKSSSLYSVNHPTSVKAINTIFGQLQKLFEQKEVVTLQVTNTGEAILEALELEVRYKISFWDALIVQAAETSGAAVLYTEDLSSGQTYRGVRVVNPLIAQQS